MSLESDALPGAGLIPAAERLRNMIAAAHASKIVAMPVSLVFAKSLVELLELAGATLESQGESVFQSRNSLHQLLDHCYQADGQDGHLSTATVRRICNAGLAS